MVDIRGEKESGQTEVERGSVGGQKGRHRACR